jgi:tungstate transport system substrate-binding protein
MKRSVCLLLLVLALMFFSVVNVSSKEKEIICASTTSTENSGLLGYILPMFEKKTGIKVKVVARGTGAAIEMAKRGDADVVLVHAKDQEIKGIKSASDAFRKIAESKNLFVSRGDNSGTHTKELALWKRASIDPKGQKWYLEAGQGMEKTQRIANEKRAYTLTDRGTWLATREKDKLEMVIVLEGDPLLFNQYGVMAVNPEKQKYTKYKEAMEFVNWLISPEGQKAIASFKDKYGNQLFIPNAK